MYKNGKSNLEKLKSFGGTILHGVDATKMQHHPDLNNRKFDRIIYNFPHAGFHGSEDNSHLIQMHKNLVGMFFRSAKKMLRIDGQIHVTHKTTPPYDLWDLVGLASRKSLICFECADFKIENYPGYNNKRGAGSKCDEPFHLGECSTFKFKFNPPRKNVPRTKQKKRYLHAPSQNLEKVPNSISPPIYSFQQQLCWIDSRNSPTCVPNMNGFPIYAHQNFQKVPNSISPPIYSFQQQLTWSNSRNSPANFNDMNGFPSHAGLPARHDPRSECFRIFNPYFSYIQKTFGSENMNVEVSVRRALHDGALMFRDEARSPPEDYLKILAELQFCSRTRVMRLQQKLQDLDRRLFEQQGVGYYL
ncbi:hypothetical protein HAX54_007212 [Datura stramonium]|uniref:25S rRNA (uridine-N(3))-methyltransferase BMT5-like domain-containing protein n=1 Tax=Datura stramonium TaxID=4076 RepID=A0ABS8RUW0_DATST|nr:hypothetical protein [Datura stramonium]